MRWPIIPSIVVAAAIATMIGLGFWQLRRMHEEEAKLSQYASARDLPSVAWPTVPLPKQLPLYRKSSVTCLKILKWQAIAGRNEKGEAGFAHYADCQILGGEGPGARIAVGWTRRPDNPGWQGGTLPGIIAPDGQMLIHLVAKQKVPGFEVLATPAADGNPAKNLSYAIQWFFFAAAAGLIYVLALRKQQSKEKGAVPPLQS